MSLQHVAFGRSRTISSAKNGLPADRDTIVVANPATEESRPSSSVTSDEISESLSGTSEMVWAPGIRLNAPRYSGR